MPQLPHGSPMAPSASRKVPVNRSSADQLLVYVNPPDGLKIACELSTSICTVLVQNGPGIRRWLGRWSCPLVLVSAKADMADHVRQACIYLCRRPPQAPG